MIAERKSTLKTLTQFGALLTLVLAASACTHEQLKQEADVAAIEDTATPDLAGAPTPDVSEPVADLADAPTPIPGDVARATPRHRAKKAVKHHHPKRHAAKKKHVKFAKRHRAEAKVAAAGTVDSHLSPPPTGPSAPVEATVPAPNVPTDAALSAPLADESSGHGLVICLAGLALGGLAFAGVRVRRARGSRRLVFS